MPDTTGFTHEPHWGNIYHRCIHCDFPGWGVFLTEKERQHHARTHAVERAKEIERKRRENLRLAQQAQRQQERENEIAYASEGR